MSIVQDCYGKTYTVKWKQVSSDRFDDMLGVLPPVAFTGSGFMVGEAWTHRIVDGREYPAYAGFKHIEGKFYECLAPLTVTEFKAVTVADVVGVV